MMNCLLDLTAPSATQIHESSTKRNFGTIYVYFIQVEDKVISPINTARVTLKPQENTLVVEYAALDYSRPEKIQYAYRIEQNASDTQWNLTSQRSLTFTNLAPGIIYYI